MKTAANYIDEIKARNGLPSDYDDGHAAARRSERGDAFGQRRGELVLGYQ